MAGCPVGMAAPDGGLPHPPSPLPQGGRGSSVALGRYFAEVVGGLSGGDDHASHAILRFRAVRPARFAHDGLGCHDAGQASQLGACRKVLLFLALTEACF
ncbi:hypothetical protein GCM10017784_26210 [Deinococcus indicus]|nr:hypothetical protein GCM10017784_26210 [Deinococcus indicus]